MSASNAFETALLQHVFTNAAIADIGDAAGLQPSSAAGDLYIALHTADPGEGGNQSTSEATYTGYARVAVPRSGAGWTVDDDEASNAAVIEFPTCTGGSNTLTHFSVGVEGSGAEMILFSGLLEASGVPTPLSVSNGITPSFAIGALIVTAD